MQFTNKSMGSLFRLYKSKYTKQYKSGSVNAYHNEIGFTSGSRASLFKLPG